jgi:hypothetical protein
VDEVFAQYEIILHGSLPLASEPSPSLIVEKAPAPITAQPDVVEAPRE